MTGHIPVTRAGKTTHRLFTMTETAKRRQKIRVKICLSDNARWDNDNSGREAPKLIFKTNQKKGSCFYIKWPHNFSFARLLLKMSRAFSSTAGRPAKMQIHNDKRKGKKLLEFRIRQEKLKWKWEVWTKFLKVLLMPPQEGRTKYPNSNKHQKALKVRPCLFLALSSKC